MRVQVLQDSANQGFQTLCNLMVVTCNGVAVSNLKHLAELLEEGKNNTVQKIVLVRSPRPRCILVSCIQKQRRAFLVLIDVIVCLCAQEDDRVIVLETAIAEAVHKSILQRHRIEQDANV